MLLDKLEAQHAEAAFKAKERQERLERLRMELAKAATASSAGIGFPQKAMASASISAAANTASKSYIGNRVLSMHDNAENTASNEAAERVAGLLALPERPGMTLGDLMSSDESRKALLALGPDIPPSVLMRALDASNEAR